MSDVRVKLQAWIDNQKTWRSPKVLAQVAVIEAALNSYEADMDDTTLQESIIALAKTLTLGDTHTTPNDKRGACSHPGRDEEQTQAASLRNDREISHAPRHGFQFLREALQPFSVQINAHAQCDIFEVIDELERDGRQP